MTIDEAPARLKELLAEAGTSSDEPDPARAWEAFKRFAAEPIEGLDPEDDVDRLLFEAGPTKYGPDGQPAVSVDFERQLTLEDDGQYGGMRHVLCTFAYPIGIELPDRAGVQEWGVPGERAAAWIERVEATAYIPVLRQPPILAELVAGDI